MEVWEPKSEVRDPVSKVWESVCGVWELKGKVWDLSSHQLPLNLTPAGTKCAKRAKKCKFSISLASHHNSTGIVNIEF